ncbi:MAG: 4-(cytidine 5'-diphospho)-2-C-methyl-D-erythritol kinase [Parvularculaceae bacterium]
MIREIAPAKVNLYLHVGGLRADGLHELASLIVFAGDGDVVEAAPADELSLEVDGPFAGPLRREPVERNLVWRAAAGLRALVGERRGARLRLDKRLPIAAGVGGGSADAAAALRALIKLWRADVAPGALARLAFSLGADVPACLARAPVLVSGAGERLAPLPGPRLAPAWLCLVNVGVATPTGPIFSAYDAAAPAPPAPRLARPYAATIAGLVRLLGATRNDLEPVAVAAEPAIAEALNALGAAPGGLGARMSGSGATVFGVFSSASAAKKAACAARARSWWSCAAPIVRA